MTATRLRCPEIHRALAGGGRAAAVASCANLFDEDDGCTLIWSRSRNQRGD